MKVLIINKSDNRGGAAVAASRLMAALRGEGLEARMLVCERNTGNAQVSAIGHRWWMKWCFLWERLCIWAANHFSRTNLFAVDIANAGFDITRLPEFQEADVIHLHWINQGMLSIADLRKIARSGKPVVWTMHDMWPCTGICHHARECTAYRDECRWCAYLRDGGSQHDLSNSVFLNKKRLYADMRVHFVACSQWLAGLARQSALLQGKEVTAIPNPIDTTVFHRKSQSECRQRLGLPEDRRLLLFGAANTADKRKGIDYLVEACNILAKRHPEQTDRIGLLVLGGNAEAVARLLPFKVWPLGYVTDTEKTVDIYNAADAFVTPSLEENLPNMIMESMACGLPCAGFEIGGVPEMIDHKKTGYVARYKDSGDLADAIHWTLMEADRDTVAHNAQEKVSNLYSRQAVARQYIEIYRKTTSFNTPK